MISYELSYGIALATVILLANSMSLREIVDQQAGYWFGFIPRWTCSDVPAAGRLSSSTPLPALPRPTARRSIFPKRSRSWSPGYHTEYSSMAFAMFFLAEYINMITVSAVATNLFLGGWHGPFLPPEYGWIWFLIKLGVLLFVLSVDALDAAALPLRPADGVRLEGAAAGGDGEPARDGGGGDLLWALSNCSSTRLPALTVLGSLFVIGQRNPIYSVLALIGAFFGLSGLYVLLEAPFVAIVQIIIYAGAIMVLFLFVVMLLNVPREDAAEWDRTHPLYRPWPMRIGALLAVLLVGQLGWALIADAGH